MNAHTGRHSNAFGHFFFLTCIPVPLVAPDVYTLHPATKC